MTLKRVELLSVFYEPRQGVRKKMGRLAWHNREILFEYDPEFLASGLEMSPFKLPARPGVHTGSPEVFQGLMGVFEDSLPDAWGRLLLDRKMIKQGFSPAQLSPLDRLAWVGSRSMGALVYEPEQGHAAATVVDLSEIARDVQQVLEEKSGPDLDRLLALGGSPQGARPKALVQVSKEGDKIIYGAECAQKGYTPYLVKFRAMTDTIYAGALEHAYAKMALLAGIEMPETQLLGQTKKHPGYFAIRRFDREGSIKTHMHTVSGLLHAPHTYPALTYRDVLLLARQLTRSESAVKEMFRRACFNVMAHNRDDHSKNFAFLMDEKGRWRPSPAYDLTFSEGPGGEHAMLIAGEGRNPTAHHLKQLAQEVGLKKPQEIIDEVSAAVMKFSTFAQESGVPRALRGRVGHHLFHRK